MIAATIVGGLVLLLLGGELLVRGAVQVASSAGLSPLVIGVTLVGFGTSSPELVTSVQAAMQGAPGIAYGNIVGSNIANSLLLLGIGALIAPIKVTSGALRRDAVVMIAAVGLFVVLGAFAPFGRVVGGALVLLLIGYVWLTLHREGRSPEEHGAAFDKGMVAQASDTALAPQSRSRHTPLVPGAIALAGLGLLVAGGALLVGASRELAQSLGISETIIGLTIVAVGTSLPELTVSIVAAVRGQSELAFGNIVGSNIYNILGIGGVTAILSPAPLQQQLAATDNLVLVVSTMLVTIFAATQMRINRWEGGLLVAGYATYVGYLWISAL